MRYKLFTHVKLIYYFKYTLLVDSLQVYFQVQFMETKENSVTSVAILLQRCET